MTGAGSTAAFWTLPNGEFRPRSRHSISRPKAVSSVERSARSRGLGSPDCSDSFLEGSDPLRVIRATLPPRRCRPVHNKQGLEDVGYRTGRRSIRRGRAPNQIGLADQILHLVRRESVRAHQDEFRRFLVFRREAVRPCLGCVEVDHDDPLIAPENAVPEVQQNSVSRYGDSHYRRQPQSGLAKTTLCVAGWPKSRQVGRERATRRCKRGERTDNGCHREGERCGKSHGCYHSRRQVRSPTRAANRQRREVGFPAHRQTGSFDRGCVRT
jgi:hypothetical protein